MCARRCRPLMSIHVLLKRRLMFLGASLLVCYAAGCCGLLACLSAYAQYCSISSTLATGAAPLGCLSWSLCGVTINFVCRLAGWAPTCLRCGGLRVAQQPMHAEPAAALELARTRAAPQARRRTLRRGSSACRAGPGVRPGLGDVCKLRRSSSFCRAWQGLGFLRLEQAHGQAAPQVFGLAQWAMLAACVQHSRCITRGIGWSAIKLRAADSVVDSLICLEAQLCGLSCLLVFLSSTDIYVLGRNRLVCNLARSLKSDT